MSDRISNISFSSLSEPITPEEIQEYAKDAGSPPYFLRSILIIATLIAATVLSLFSVMDFPGLPLLLVILIFMVGTFLYFTVTTFRKHQRRFALLKRFASRNGAEAKSNTFPQGYDGLIFNQGHSRRITLSVAFPDGLELGNYTYAEGGGKNTKFFTWSFIAVPLNRPMPHIILDAKSNNMLGRFTNLPVAYQSTQKISLEGDFDSYFTLYAPQDYDQDILYLFTPDVMVALIDHGQSYDIEIINQTMYLYRMQTIDFDSESSLRIPMSTANILAQKIIDQNQNYRDSRLQMPTNAEQVTSIASQSTDIASQGRKLKVGIKASSVISFIVVMLYFIMIANQSR